jgi:hypothetical protein
LAGGIFLLSSEIVFKVFCRGIRKNMRGIRNKATYKNSKLPGPESKEWYLI